jgi:hypothetical protein
LSKQRAGKKAGSSPTSLVASAVLLTSTIFRSSPLFNTIRGRVAVVFVLALGNLVASILTFLYGRQIVFAPLSLQGIFIFSNLELAAALNPSFDLTGGCIRVFLHTSWTKLLTTSQQLGQVDHD